MQKIILIFVLLLSPISDLHAGDLESLNNKMVYFYQDPTQEKFNDFQQEASENFDELAKTNSKADILVSVMFVKIKTKHGWGIIPSKLKEKTDEILARESELARFVYNDEIVNSFKLDMWWTSYFATGEDRYLDKLFYYVGQEVSKKRDMGRFMIVRAATWSFKSNCIRHKGIRDYASSVIGDHKDKKRAVLEYCMSIAE